MITLVSMAMNTDVNMLIPSTMNAGFILVFALEMNGYSLPHGNEMINRLESINGTKIQGKHLSIVSIKRLSYLLLLITSSW